jgi:hypothetical protein
MKIEHELTSVEAAVLQLKYKKNEMCSLMLKTVFTSPMIVLYFVFVSTSITMIFYSWIKQVIAQQFSYCTVEALQRPGHYSHKEINFL